MPRPPDPARANQPPAPASRRRLRLGALVVVALALLATLIFYPRYRDKQRARREAAERARWAQSAAQHKAVTLAGKPRPPTDHGPALLAELQRGVLAVAPALGQASLAAALAAPLAPAASDALLSLGMLMAQPGLPWLPPIGHGAPIDDASLSPDATLLLTAGGEGGVQIHDAQTGHLIARLHLSPKAGAVQLARFSPDGLRVATASADGAVQLWAAHTGQELLTAKLDLPPGAIRDAAFAPDGRLLAIATATGIGYLVDSRTGTLSVKLLGHRDEVTMSSFSPDGTRVVTASADGMVRMFAVASGGTLAVWKAHSLGARVARFSSDGLLVVTAGNEATVRVWDARSFTNVAELRGHLGEVLSARFSPDGTQLVTASADHTARLWEARTGRLLASLNGHAHPLTDAVFAPDGAAVLTAAVDGEARLWALPSQKTLAVLHGHQARLTALEFTSDGERLLTAGLDGFARVWTARPSATADPGRLLLHPQLVAAHFSPTGDLLATIGRDASVRLWDPRDGRLRRTLAGHAYAVNAAVFTPDGHRLLTASDDGSVRVWDARSGLCLHTLLGHTHPVRSLSVSPDGRLALTVDLGGTARLWGVRDGQALGLYTEPKPAGAKLLEAEFSPDGERLLTIATQGLARLWNVHTLTLQTSLGQGQAIRATDFSPDGSRVLTATDDRLVHLWDSRSPGPLAVPLATLAGQSAQLSVARFAPDALRVLTAAPDLAPRLWDVATQQVLVSLGERTVPAGPASPASPVRTAAFSPDGLHVLTGDSDGRAVVWEAATGKALIHLAGRGAVVAAEFSPDGHSVLLGHAEGEVQVVTLSAVPLVSAACRLLRNHDHEVAGGGRGVPAGAAAGQPGWPWRCRPAMGAAATGGLWTQRPVPDGGATETLTWRHDLALRSHEIPAGCFAFSTKLHTAACRVRYRATASSPRERIAVTFVPPVFPPIPVEPEVGDSIDPRCPPLVWGAALTTLQGRLAAGDFTPLLATAYRPLPEGPEVALGSSGAYLSWFPDPGTRVARAEARGRPERVLQVRCAGGKRHVLHAYSSLKEEVTAAVAALPEGKRLIVRLAISSVPPATAVDSAAPRAREERIILLDPRTCATQAPAGPELP